MKKILSFIRKEFYHILRDKRTMLILIGMPMVQILLFGFAISNEVKDVRFAYYAPHDNNDISRLVQNIDASDYFVFVGKYTTKEEIDDALQTNKVDVVINFDKDFSMIGKSGETPKMEITVDACDPNTATSEAAIVTGIIQQYFQSETNAKMLVNAHVRLLYNPRMESSYNFVPGIMGMILMLICAMMTSVSIVREKEMGTMEVLLVSPTRPINIILTKMVPYFVMSCVNLATILVLSVTLLKLPIAGSVVSVISVSVLYILLALSLGLLISTVMKTQVTAMLMSAIMLLFPTIMLSGMMYPIENMPAVLQYFSCVVPARWFISAVRKLMIEGLSITSVWKEISILTGMLVLLTTISLRKFNVRLE